MLQCVAVRCSVLQCGNLSETAVLGLQCCVAKRHVSCCSVLQYVAVCRSELQCVVVCCSELQCVALCCSALQCAEE